MRVRHFLSGMIRTTTLAFAGLFIPFVIISCSGNDKDNPVEEPDEPYDAGEFNRPKFETESALYKIPSGDSGLRSIELTASGFYIVITDVYSKDNSGQIAAAHSAPSFVSCIKSLDTRSYESNGIITGSYTKKGDGEFVLEGFGTIVVIGGEKNAVSLDITLNNGRKIEVGAQKAEQYDSSTKTNAMCRTWDLGQVVVHKTEGDVTYANYHEYEKGESQIYYDDSVVPMQVLFTKSGTYIVIREDHTLAVSTWAWSDEAAGRIRYSWNYDNLFEEGVSNFVDIAFEGKQMLVTEYLDWPTTYYMKEAR